MREDFLWLQVRRSRRMMIMSIHSTCPSQALQFFLLQMDICGFWHPTKGLPLSSSSDVPPSHGCSWFSFPACCRMVSRFSWSKQTTVPGASIKCLWTGSIFHKEQAIPTGRQNPATPFKPWVDEMWPLVQDFPAVLQEETVEIWKICHFCNGCEGCNTQFYHFQIFATVQLQIETCFIFSVSDYSVEKRWGWRFTGIITGLCSQLVHTLQVWEKDLLQIRRKPQLRDCMCHKQLHNVKLRETFAMCAPSPS